MKLIGSALCVATACAVSLGAQTGTTKVTTESGNDKTTVKTTVEVKDGKDIKTIGCIETNPGGGYMLTSVDTGTMRYTLVTDDDLSKYVGHRVQMFGKATDLGEGKVRIESKTTSESHGEVGTTGRTTETTESKGDLRLPYLGVKSVKIVAGFCH
jgi:hypothetical protein